MKRRRLLLDEVSGNRQQLLLGLGHLIQIRFAFDEVKAMLKREFKMTDLGVAKRLLHEHSSSQVPKLTSTLRVY
ncbi:hypothetical protein QYE76_051432 [Lolium multiflorum]|uniref:Uncharacterized protein n=1 Tax=Lolium multiflorum TaxID=4521 RepID=A0AAD8STN0_LOLMU|nr:hypothetical protein QYE76_051432 [Lolium multiflorum]